MSLNGMSLIFVFAVVLAGCSFKKTPAERNASGSDLTASGAQLQSDEESLWNAVAAGRLADLQVLIEQNPSVDLNALRKGETALSVALRRGDFEVAALLMSYGASPFIPLKVDGISAFESVDLYAARFRSVITSQADLIIRHFSWILVNSSSDKLVEFFSKNAIPCEMALEKLRKAPSRDTHEALNEAAGLILDHELCKSIAGKRLEKMLTDELMDTLGSYSQNFTVLKALIRKIPYVPAIVIEDRNLEGVLNPVFLIKHRAICGSPFKNEEEVVSWRKELISLFPSQSGIAYEVAVKKENSLSMGSGRALIIDFESMDMHDERRALVVSLTGIKNFFECEGDH